MFHVFRIDLGRASDFNDFAISQKISPFDEDIVYSLWGRNLILNIFYFRESNLAIKCLRMTRMNFHSISIASWFNLLFNFYVHFLYKDNIPVSCLWAFPFLSLTYYRTSNDIIMLNLFPNIFSMYITKICLKSCARITQSIFVIPPKSSFITFLLSYISPGVFSFLIWMLSVLYKVLATIYCDSVKEINHVGEFTLFCLVSRKILKK